MIHYLVTRQAGYTMDIHKASWAGELRHKISVIYYDQIVHYKKLPVGLYIISDLERLGPAEIELAGIIHRTLGQSQSRVLNDPTKVLRRESLLKTLKATGMNPFTVYRLNEDWSNATYPLFIRRENDHSGSLSELLHSPADVKSALEKLRSRGPAQKDLLLVEYFNTADSDGIYRKYSAFCIGGKIIPRHVLASKQWVLKSPDLVDPPYIAEEQDYSSRNPHEAELKKVFAIANIDYGRIDYSLHNGQLVTWEINTNPMAGIEPAKMAIARLPVAGIFAQQFNAALESLDVPSQGQSVPLTVPKSVMLGMTITRSKRSLRLVGRAIQKLQACWPLRAAMEASN